MRRPPPWPLDHVVPVAALRVGQHLGLAGEQVGEEPHVVGMVRHDQEIERPRQLGRLAGGRDDLLPARKAIGIAPASDGAKAPASNEYAVWRWVSPKSGRVGKFAQHRASRAAWPENLVCGCLVQGAEIRCGLRSGRRREEQTQRKGAHGGSHGHRSI